MGDALGIDDDDGEVVALLVLLADGGDEVDELSVGVGLEYVFADFLYARAGYTFNSTDRSFSSGIGARLALGFTEYSVDYTFRPMPDYGFLHSVGVSVSF